MEAVLSGFGAREGGEAPWGLQVSSPPHLIPSSGPLPSTSLPTKVPERPPTEQPQAER